MRRELCAVKECGATVLLLEVDGETVPVNPARMEVVAGDEAAGFHRVTGYQPHYMTCVDITARAARAPGRRR